MKKTLHHLFTSAWLAIQKQWPYIGVFCFVIVLCFPFWSQPDFVFMGLISGDNIASPWFYDFVSRHAYAQQPIDFLVDFNYPTPIARQIEFPNYWDALLLAPLAKFFGFPQFWGVVITVAILINAMSLAVLSRAIGGSPLGIFVAGVFGASMRPVWVDIGFGRMNAVFIGYGVMAMAFVLLSIPKAKRHWGWTLVFSGLACFFGFMAAQVYPPFLVLLFPIGVVLLKTRVHRDNWKWLGGPVFILFLTYWLVADDLMAMVDSHYRQLNCIEYDCPDAYHRTAFMNFFLFSNNGLSTIGLSGYAVVLGLGSICLRHGQWWLRLSLFALLLLYGVLALGPCPVLYEDTPIQLPSWLSVLLQPLWCWGLQLHDFARFASVFSVMIIVAISQFASSIVSYRRWLKLCCFAFVGIAGLGNSIQLSLEINESRKWHPVDRPTAVPAFLLNQNGEPAVEFPYEKGLHVLSVLHAPKSPRVNPLRLSDKPKSKWVFFQWADRIGRGKKSKQVPNKEQINGSGVRWVFYEPSRCGKRFRHCPEWVLPHLTDVLGEPVELDEGVWMWDLWSPP